MTVDINKILNEVRVLGCSDLHFTSEIAPVVRLNGSLRKLSSYPVMDEEFIMDIVDQMTTPEKKYQSTYRYRLFVYDQAWLPSQS